MSDQPSPAGDFGDAVDINDGILVVGEPRVGNGALHVFMQSPLVTTWEHVGRLVSAGAGLGLLGDRVGVSGSTVVGGVPQEAVPPTLSVGEVAVFDLALSIFSDGFESGDLSMWSSHTP